MHTTQQRACQAVQLSFSPRAVPLTGFSLPDAVSVRMLTVVPLDYDFPGGWCVSVQPIPIDIRENPIPVLGHPDRTLCETWAVKRGNERGLDDTA